jgi:hypothetical protein
MGTGRGLPRQRARKHACQWFWVAAVYSEDKEVRQMCCIEAYGWSAGCVVTFKPFSGSGSSAKSFQDMM